MNGGVRMDYGTKISERMWNQTDQGPGAFARTIPNEILVKIMKDPIQRKDFLEFCHEYDSNSYVCVGKDNLFAKGDIEL